MVLSVLLNIAATPFEPKESIPPKDSIEYVRYLERLVAELGTVFAHVVHNNPPDVSHNFNGNSAPLPDLVLSATSSKLGPSSPDRDLRARRGLTPIRCGAPDSMPGSSCATPLLVTPDLTTPSTSASTSSVFSFCDDVISPSSPSSSSTDQRETWRQVGRDLRDIADDFALSRAARTQQVSNEGSSWLSSIFALIWAVLIRKFL